MGIHAGLRHCPGAAFLLTSNAPSAREGWEADEGEKGEQESGLVCPFGATVSVLG